MDQRCRDYRPDARGLRLRPDRGESAGEDRLISWRRYIRCRFARIAAGSPRAVWSARLNVGWVWSEHAVRELPDLFALGEWLGRNIPPTMTPGVIWRLPPTIRSRLGNVRNGHHRLGAGDHGDCYMDLALMLMFWGDYRTQEPPAFQALQAISRQSERLAEERWPVGGDAGRPLNI